MPPLSSLTIFDHLLAATLVVGLTVIATLKWPRAKLRLRQDPERYRVPEYRKTILLQWGLLATLLALWVWQARPLPELGLGLPLGWGLLIAAALAFAAIAFLALQVKKVRAKPTARQRLRNSKALKEVEEILPNTPRQFRWFAALSITAGICEETLYRGFLIWYFHHAMPLWPAVLAASAVFGSAHLYQGFKGVPKTGIVGLVMALFYLLSGSLWTPMLIHAYVDINGGQMGMLAFGAGGDEDGVVASAEGESHAPIPAIETALPVDAIKQRAGALA